MRRSASANSPVTSCIRTSGCGRRWSACASNILGTVEALGLWHLGRFADRGRCGRRFAGAQLWSRELLVAHTYWRLRGFKADLVILNREPASYEQPLHQQLLRLVEAHSLHTGVDQPGGVFLRKADQMPEEDLNLILTVARQRWARCADRFRTARHSSEGNFSAAAAADCRSRIRRTTFSAIAVP